MMGRDDLGEAGGWLYRSEKALRKKKSLRRREISKHAGEGKKGRGQKRLTRSI